MNIKTNFDIGEPVWAVIDSKKETDCRVCGGKGNLGEQELIVCPRCHRGKVYKTESIIAECFISGIHISLHFGFENKYETYHITKKGEDPFCSSHLIYSSSYNIFRTKQEAEEYCTRLNAQNREMIIK